MLNLLSRVLVTCEERFPQCYKLSVSGYRFQRYFSERLCQGFCSLFDEPTFNLCVIYQLRFSAIIPQFLGIVIDFLMLIL